MLLIFYLLVVARFALCNADYFVRKNVSDVPASCGANEELRACGHPCPLTCDTLYTHVCCNFKCSRGCFCRDGYMLVSKVGPRRCVAVNDCPKPGILEFQSSAITVVESSKVAVIQVLRIDGSAGEISVRWRTVEGSAKERTDFLPSSGTLNFPDGVTLRTITVQIVDDSIAEPNEDFLVILSDPTNRAEISPRRLEGVRVTIQDDDWRPGYLEVLNNSISVPENIGTIPVTLIRIGGIDGNIRILYKTADGTARAQLDYVPIRGVITFNPGENRKTVQLTIIDDEILEPIENFQLQFYDPSSDIINFRQLSSSLLTVVNIIDNDMRPGYIEFELLEITVVETIGTLNITIIRIGGSDGQISIRYKTADGSAKARTDYNPISGIINFNDGETKKVISLTIIDDDIREPLENFKVVLHDPSAGPNVINFRSSGNRLEASIIIIDNDMKPGYFQLSNPVISISESVGTIKIGVGRLGGQDGEIRIKYRTVDGTATSPTDYLQSSGELVFQDGVTNQHISINIVNDLIFEPTENFRLELFDATVATDVINFRGLGSRVSTIITIRDDDMKPGYFQLSNPVISIPESVGTIKIGVGRLGGQDGEIRIKYRTVDGTATSPTDYLQSSGELVFQDGVTNQHISINIVNDLIFEPTENFRLELFDATVATDVINFRGLGSRVSTIITIRDDDMKPGYFQLSKPFITISESVGTIKISVGRLGGQDGEIRIKYRTVDGTATSPNDYLQMSGDLVFQDGVTQQQISINIVNDLIFEPSENFRFELFDATAATDVINFRGLRSSVSTIITIMDDDMKPGYFQLSKPFITISESVGSIKISVGRLGGQDGEIRIKYRTVDGTATFPNDYLQTSGDLVFQDGVTQQQISINIVNDLIFEPTENFRFELFDATAATGVINFRGQGSEVSTIITILDDDMEPGYLELENANSTITENYGTVQVTIVRIGGSDGILQLKYRTIDGTAIAGTDYKHSTGDLTFEDGETRKTISVIILNDEIKENTKHFQVELYDITPGDGTINFRNMGTKLTSLITIIDDDKTPGFAELEKPSMTASESIGIIFVPVIRNDGSDGELRVGYQTVDVSAVAGFDYKPKSGVIIFKDGEINKNISVEIINDQVREEVKIFHVVLFDLNSQLAQVSKSGQAPELGQIPQTEQIQPVELRRGSQLRQIPLLGQVPQLKQGPQLRQVPLLGQIPPLKQGPQLAQVPLLGQVLPLGQKSSLKQGPRLGQVPLLGQIPPLKQGPQLGQVPLLGQIPPLKQGPLLGQVPPLKQGPLLGQVPVSRQAPSLKQSPQLGQLPLPAQGPQLGQVGYRTLGPRLTTIVSIIDDDERPGVIGFERKSLTIREDSGVVQITVLRVGGTDGTLVMKYKAIAGTAIPLVDFKIKDEELVFKEGVDKLIISIEIVDDRIKEQDKTFSLLLFEPAGQSQSLGEIASISIIIIDDDNYPGVFEFQKVRTSVLENIRTLPITIIRSGGSDGQVSVQVFTRSKSATIGIDYNPPYSVIIFPDGTHEQKVHLWILDDNVKEQKEEFIVGLFNPTNGGILGENNMLTVEIVDDDDDPSVIRFQQSSSRFNKDHGIAGIQVLREGPLDKEVSVLWKFEATDLHYRGSSSDLLTFSPRQREVTIPIFTENIEDAGDILFDIVLFSPSEGAIVGEPAKHTIKVLDTSQRVNQPPIPNVPFGTQVSFLMESIRVRESDQEVVIPIGRSGRGIPFTIHIMTADGSATGRQDYVRVMGPVTFDKDDAEIHVRIRIIDDNVREPEESFTIVLFNPSSGLISLGTKVVTIIIEDDDGDIFVRRDGGASGIAPSTPRQNTRPPAVANRPGSSYSGLVSKCADHLILKTCANTCPPTCSNMNRRGPCSHNGCIRGCWCPDGLVKESELNERCIRPSECPGGLPSRGSNRPGSSLWGSLR